MKFTPPIGGYKGLKNGRLLQVAEEDGYDILLTLDRGIPHQQNAAARRIAILIIKTPSNRMEDLLERILAVLNCLSTIRPGEIVFVT